MPTLTSSSYLGDALVHSAFPILLFAHNLFNPLLLLGPLANYVFLRYVGGDKENEASQEERYAMTDPAKLGQFHQYQVDKNAFWPKPAELVNKWVWICAAAGGAVVAVERVVRSVL
jgi:steroid 5-alpha reductase family enzyme